jgi:hypothetical protein
VTRRCPSVSVVGGRAVLWHAQASPCISPFEDTSTPSITGHVGTSRAWAMDTSSRDMAFPSARPLGPSRGLHPRASLVLLYPSLCRMSSPSDRRAAPRPAVLGAALAGMLGGAPDGRRRGNTVTRSVCAVTTARTAPRGSVAIAFFHFFIWGHLRYDLPL